MTRKLLSGFGTRDWYKRPFDLSVLVVVHVALFPILLILWVLIPLAIWLEDRGPIFYTQLRVGRAGKVFRLYKFRSMIPNAEKFTGPVWAFENDHRVTKVGRFLRNRALDELPQVINMWKGELSLVGPRPERPELLAQFLKETPRFTLRMNLRPGLTGLAQLKGRYTTKPKDKLRYDIIYMKNMSPLLDCILLAMSVFVTLKAGWQVSKDGKR